LKELDELLLARAFGARFADVAVPAGMRVPDFGAGDPAGAGDGGGAGRARRAGAFPASIARVVLVGDCVTPIAYAGVGAATKRGELGQPVGVRMVTLPPGKLLGEHLVSAEGAAVGVGLTPVVRLKRSRKAVGDPKPT
jgi:hypothetical protein